VSGPELQLELILWAVIAGSNHPWRALFWAFVMGLLMASR